MNINPLPENRSPLQKSAFRALPLGAVRPRGWLRDQLKLQANGLTGHLDEIWTDVGLNSGWLGGSGESWERGPYYCDGLVPLAYILDDPTLLAKANKWISWTLDSMQPSGQFGPQRNIDWWPRVVMLKVLTNYYEAEQDGRVLDLMLNYFRYQNQAIISRPFENWSMARGADNLLSVFWLYNLTGESFLLELGQKIASNTANWAEWQGHYRLKEILPLKDYYSMFTHVVNNAMGIKAPAVSYLQTGESWHREAAKAGINNLMKYHGQPNGIWSGDEHLNSTSPTQGTELCAIVEYMFSLEEVLRITGDPFYADILESVAYNALPATFKPDMWAHQYDQQVNQVVVSVAHRNWANNFDDSNIFGLEPNFGCCTANMHQGWPKFLKNLIMMTPDNGLAAGAYGPCEATINLSPDLIVKMVEDTSYPFDGKIKFTFSLNKPARFPLLLRVPEWAGSATLRINHQESLKFGGSGYHRVERDWLDGDSIEMALPMQLRIATGHEGLASIYRGPLLFGLKIGEDWRNIKGEEPHADWEVYPTTPWNYGLSLSLDNPSSNISVLEGELSHIPFDPSQAPVTLIVPARRLPQWGLKDNSAAPISGGPHRSTAPIEQVELIPYGSTNLRVAAFPKVEHG